MCITLGRLLRMQDYILCTHTSRKTGNVNVNTSISLFRVVYASVSGNIIMGAISGIYLFCGKIIGCNFGNVC